MGLFGKLFGAKDTTEEILVSSVYMTRTYVNQIVAGLVNEGNVIAIAFFASTKDHLTSLCTTEESKNRIVLFNANTGLAEINSIRNFLSASTNRIVCAERYPLQQREAELLQKLGMNEASAKSVAYCALNDALMLQFGGERVTTLMQKMGMTETEAIVHSMVNASIINAQKKLFRKVTYEQQAKSPEDWFRLNVPQS